MSARVIMPTAPSSPSTTTRCLRPMVRNKLLKGWGGWRVRIRVKKTNFEGYIISYIISD